MMPWYNSGALMGGGSGRSSFDPQEELWRQMLKQKQAEEEYNLGSAERDAYAAQMEAGGRADLAAAIRAQMAGKYDPQHTMSYGQQMVSPLGDVIHTVKDRPTDPTVDTSPASVQEWRFREALPPEKQAEWDRQRKITRDAENARNVAEQTRIGQEEGQKQADFPTYMKAQQSAKTELDVQKRRLQELHDMTDITTTGVAGLAKDVPILPPKQWAERAKTIASNIALNKMQELKSLSPTGATGFGALSQKELEVLEKAQGSLDQTNDPEEIKKIINEMIASVGRLDAAMARSVHEDTNWYRKKNNLPEIPYVEPEPEPEPVAPPPVKKWNPETKRFE